MADSNTSEVTQYCATIVSLICAFACSVAYCALPKWRKLNYLHAKQIMVKCVATCCIVAIIIFPEEYFSRETLVITYFAIVLTTVVGTVHILILGHIHVALSCEEIPDEEALVKHTWYYMTAETAFVLYCVKTILSLDYLAVDCLIGILLLAISTGNILLLSRIFKLVGKCTITFMFCVNVLGVFCDVFLVLYGGLLVNGDEMTLFHDVVTVTYTSVMVLLTGLVLCSKDAMDWNKFKCSSDDMIEM